MTLSTFKTPVTIVSGFLGGGKTTLLGNLLNQTHDRTLALIVNEFGEVSIDGPLLETREDGVELHDVHGGLLAYGGEGDAFRRTLHALKDRRHTFDHVLIETSGLAVPTAVMVTLEEPEFSSDFALDATLVVVDTPLLLAGAFSAEAAEEAARSAARVFGAQLEYADVAVLNKIDSLTDADLLQAEADVRHRAPRVRFIELAYGARLDTQLTLGLNLHGRRSAAHQAPVSGAPGTLAQPLHDHSALDGHAHGDLDAHVHSLSTHQHFHEHDPGWQSFRLTSDDAQNVPELVRTVQNVARVFPVLRVKGFVQGEDGGRHAVQAVRSRVEVHPAPVNADAANELIFIGYHVSRKKVTEALQRALPQRWA
ncbi:CobW family GTP-binding protein [Deinococcus hopiensis]|uniref:Cobalamin biosynthesis protein CobW n=1 Tax=Deinococcus hopiensis KR-140 TaxID=695939 RepID=A0A1W1UGT2_9DEIO|nr:GTP-binding protein [Deinococcus hopiensis]SMB79984.1 cobalamin biosynthesis protein CobW [Deinococcus hopiensis KR-140]